MMSKKHYVQFAEMFSNHADNIKKNIELSTTHDAIEYHTARLQELESTVRDSMDIFQSDNPNFDRNRFLNACGLTSK